MQSRSGRVIHWLEGLALVAVVEFGVGVIAWADQVRSHSFAEDS